MIAILRHLIGLFEGLDGGLAFAGPPQGHAQVAPVIGSAGLQLHRLARMGEGRLRVAQLRIGRRREVPCQGRVRPNVLGIDFKGLLPGGDRICEPALELQSDGKLVLVLGGCPLEFNGSRIGDDRLVQFFQRP